MQDTAESSDKKNSQERVDLNAAIERDARLAVLRDAAQAAAADDPAHDFSHLVRVTRAALAIAGDLLPIEEVIAAGLLHDLVNIPKNHADRAIASERSAAEAETLLRTAGFTEDAIARIVTAVRDHSFSRGVTPSEPLAQILQDADRLDALGAIGIARCISTGERMGATYFDPDDPWAVTRPLDDRRYSVDHFFTKLFLLPSRMHTPAGRAEAERRVTFMKEFLEELAGEIGIERQRPPD